MGKFRLAAADSYQRICLLVLGVYLDDSLLKAVLRDQMTNNPASGRMNHLEPVRTGADHSMKLMGFGQVVLLEPTDPSAVGSVVVEAAAHLAVDFTVLNATYSSIKCRVD